MSKTVVNYSQEIERLQNQSLESIKASKEDALNRKAQLEELKAEGGKSWNSTKQEELNEIALFLVDVDELIEEKENAKYTPAAGTEKMVHLLIVQGRRFNPNTGKEESAPYSQMFTYAEWQLFKKNFSSLGYLIVDVLHDPYNEAKSLISK